MTFTNKEFLYDQALDLVVPNTNNDKLKEWAFKSMNIDPSGEYVTD